MAKHDKRDKESKEQTMEEVIDKIESYLEEFIQKSNEILDEEKKSKIDDKKTSDQINEKRNRLKRVLRTRLDSMEERLKNDFGLTLQQYFKKLREGRPNLVAQAINNNNSELIEVFAEYRLIDFDSKFNKKGEVDKKGKTVFEHGLEKYQASRKAKTFLGSKEITEETLDSKRRKETTATLAKAAIMAARPKEVEQLIKEGIIGGKKDIVFIKYKPKEYTLADFISPFMELKAKYEGKDQSPIDLPKPHQAKDEKKDPTPIDLLAPHQAIAYFVRAGDVETVKLLENQKMIIGT